MDAAYRRCDETNSEIPASLDREGEQKWIPASAGMTAFGKPGESQSGAIAPLPSFRRNPESSRPTIPAQAGIQRRRSLAVIPAQAAIHVAVAGTTSGATRTPAFAGTG